MVGSCVSQKLKHGSPLTPEKKRPTVLLAISGFPLWLEGLQSPLRFSRLYELSTGELSLPQPQAQLF